MFKAIVQDQFSTSDSSQTQSTKATYVTSNDSAGTCELRVIARAPNNNGDAVAFFAQAAWKNVHGNLYVGPLKNLGGAPLALEAPRAGDSLFLGSIQISLGYPGTTLVPIVQGLDGTDIDWTIEATYIEGS